MTGKIDHERRADRVDGRFERLVHDSPAIAFVREPAGAFTFVSDGVTRALGWAPEALVADPGFWAERIHPDDKARVMDHFAETARTGHCASQYRLRHADGNYRWMREEMRADGHDTLIGHWIDITESRHAEEALRDNERRFKDFAESVSDWFWETDSRHRFTAFSGLSKRDVAWFTKASIGKTRFDARLRDDREDRKWDLHRADLGARRSFRNFVFPIAAEDGSTRHIRVAGRPLFSEAGDFRGYRGTATNVTAMVEAEQRAAAAHALLWDTIESIPDALAVYDADDKLVLYNEMFRQGVLRGIGDTIEAGVTFEALLRLAVARGLTHIPDGDEEAYIQARLDHHRRGEGSLEVPLLNDRWMLSRERRMPGGGTVGVRTEITETKRIEAELSRHRDRLEEMVAERARELAQKTALLEATFESISEGFALFDGDDRLVFCNDAYREFAAPIADLIVPGVPFETLVRATVAGGHAAHPGDSLADKVGGRMARHRDPGGTLEVELGDGHWLLIAERRTGDGGTTLVQTDITDMKRAEAELRLTQTRLADAVESLPTAFTLYDSDDRLVLFNGRTTDFFPEIADDLTPGARREDVLRRLAAAGRIAGIRGHEQEWVEERLAAPSGPLPSDVVTLSDGRTLQSVRRRTSDGGLVGIWIDITERVEIEKALIEAKERADAANQAKSDFLSRMSHELRTPMNAILGFGQLLESDPREPLSDTQSSSVRHIIKAGDHLLELINDVLDLVRIEGGRIPLSIETVRPRDVIEPSLSLIRNHAAKRDIQLIDRSAARDLPNVAADFTRFKQVLINLLSNAVKYNREGGAVFLDSEAANDMLRLTVTDTGPGIPEAEHAHLFEPFTRVKDTSGEVEGTGIGLTITKQLVELMGGRIGFESATGRGSSFWFELPLALAAAEPARRPDPLAVDEIENIGEEFVATPTVLYVEDDAANLRLMEQIVQRFTNVELVSAHTAEIALEMAGENPPDVILMDINLPGMNGTEALRSLRASDATSSIPVIAVSANAMPGDIKEGLKAGFDGYLTKPIRIAEVLNVIKQAIARSDPDA